MLFLRWLGLVFNKLLNLHCFRLQTDSWLVQRFWIGDMGTELYLLGSSRHCSIGMTFGGGEDRFSCRICIPYVFSLWWHIRGWRSGKGRVFDLSIHDKALWWEFWALRDEWNHTDPWWMSGCIHPLDVLFGRLDCKHEDLVVAKYAMNMPAGHGYEASTHQLDITVGRWRWKRPRLPWVSLDAIRAEVECKEGVQYPGKWSSEDKTYSITFAVRKDLVAAKVCALKEPLRGIALAGCVRRAAEDFQAAMTESRRRG